jgi:peptide/nickel transport system substrate-binding protein
MNRIQMLVPTHGGRMLRILAVVAATVTVIAAPLVHTRAAAASSGKPAPGGSIGVRISAVEPCLDPAKVSGGGDGVIDGVVLDPLVWVDKGHIYPDLATSWKFSHGGTWITFSLRRGVRFSNGDPFTASAVKFTFDRGLDPAMKSPLIPGELGPISSVQVVDNFTVRLIMKSPYRPIMTGLSLTELGILDPKATNAGNVCDDPVGTGAFMIKSVQPGYSTVTVVRNPYRTWELAFTHNQGKPYLSSITFKDIDSDATAVSELLSGGVDSTDVGGDQLSRIQGNSSYKIFKVVTGGNTSIQFRTALAPWNNVEVRRAVAEAIDKKSLVAASLNGLGTVSYSQVAPTMPYYDKAAKSTDPKYNPNDARRLFAKHHVTGPFTLVTIDLTGLKTAAELIQADLARVGVQVNVVTDSTPDWLNAGEKGTFDMFLLDYGFTDPDFLYLVYDSKGGIFKFYSSPTLDNLIVKGRSSLKPKVASAAYIAIQRLLASKVIAVPLYLPLTVYSTGKRLQGFHVTDGYFPVYPDMYVKTSS